MLREIGKIVGSLVLIGCIWMALFTVTLAVVFKVNHLN